MDITHNRTLYSVFADYAAYHPDKEWLVFERADGQVFRWTYSEFLTCVHQAANLLNSLGIGDGDTFTLHLANHAAYPLLTLAASYLGASLVPSNPASTPDELRYLLEHSNSQVLFTLYLYTENFVQNSSEGQNAVSSTENFVQNSVRVRDISKLFDDLAHQSTTPPPYAGSPEKTLEILYTSGTTSRPKGVMLTNANFLYAVEAFRAAVGIRPDDRAMIVLPLFHGASQIHGLWAAMIAGGSVVILSRFSASRFWEQAVSYGATFCPMFGAPLRMLLNQPPHPAENAHSLRNITFAQNLTPEQYKTWQNRFKAPLQQVWGMTETCGLPILSPQTGERNLLAMGRPALGWQVKIVDEAGREVPTGEVGQLLVWGKPGLSLMRGYLNDPAATQKIMPDYPNDTWLYTGDSVYADVEGFIYFADRGKDMIKRAGERISSTEIETVLLRYDGVQEACVVSLPDEIRDEKIVAVVIGDVDAAALLDFCKQHLTPFKVPERVVFVDELPRTSVGKIQKQKVRESLLRE